MPPPTITGEQKTVSSSLLPTSATTLRSKSPTTSSSSREKTDGDAATRPSTSTPAASRPLQALRPHPPARIGASFRDNHHDRSSPVAALASSSMSHLARLALRLVAGPVAVAGFAGFQLRHASPLTAIAVSCGVCLGCVFAIAAWGNMQLARSGHRLPSLLGRRSSRTR